MSISRVEQEIQSIRISKEIEIAAPIEIAFEAMLEVIGPNGEMPGGKPFPMVIEPWPGGRWYRDLGDNSGHFWGHVQVIKPPTLLEICGPLMMSYPALNHLQYRLKAEGGVTRLVFLHRAMGLILPEHRDGLPKGWEHWLERISRAGGTQESEGDTTMSACCDAASDRKTPTWVRRVREIFAWVLPSAILVLVPKCPACLAAHVTLWTGLGLSLSTATYLRWVLLFLCVASLLFLIVERLDRIGAIFSYFKKETEQCNTK